jgi:hypothetical protein
MRAKLAARTKARKTEPRFLGITARKKRTPKVGGFFIFKGQWSKILITGFYLLAIGGFVAVLDKTLHATGSDNLATVDFYANASVVEGAGGSWTGVDRALGKPEVSDTGAAADFNEGNSAVYSGGRQALVCDNFTTEDFIKNPQTNIISKPTSTPVKVETPEIIPAATSTAGQVGTPAASSTSAAAGTADSPVSPVDSVPADNPVVSQPIVPEQTPASVSGADNSETPTAPAAEAPVVEVQNHLPESAPAAGIDSAADSGSVSAPAASDGGSAAGPVPAASNNSSADSGSAPASTPADSGSAADAGPVSLFKELKNIAALGKEAGKNLLGKMALADSLWGSAADDRNILFGAFKSATIKVSIAAIAQAAGQPAAEQNNSSAPAATSSPVEGNNSDQPASSTPSNDGNASSSSVSRANSGIGQQLLNLFAPKQASAEENNPAKAGAPIVVWYSFADEGDGNVWKELGTIDADTLANADRGGYLNFAAPFLNDWRDVDNLRLKFSGQAESGSFAAYLDSVWVEISYQNGPDKKPDDQPKNADKDKLFVDGREIDFNWTDDNSNENLIIKSNEKNYYGLTSAEMYFSVENAGVRDEAMNFQFYFPATSSQVVKMDELIPRSPYLTEVPKYEAKVYDCANGWDKRDNVWSCYPTSEQHACDEVSPNRRYCRVNGVMTGTEEKIQYADRWQEVGLADKSIAPQEGLLQKLLGLGPQLKSIPENFNNKKATADSITIAPGEVKYFKATIGFLPNSEGEFYVEAVGSEDGYGLLDPWWNSGWNYRLPIMVDNTGSASTLHDYQLYLEISSSTNRDFWRHIKPDGSDIRFANAAQTAELPYWIQSFDSTASSAKIWIKADSIPAGAKTKIYLFYGNSGANSASDQFAPFTYSSLQNIFYTASSSATKTINVVSLIDNNQVQLDNGTAVNLNRQQVAVFTGFNANSVVKAKGPVTAKISGSPALESAIPAAFAGRSFAIPSFRGTGNFNFYAPFAAANVAIKDGTVLKQSHSLAQGGAGNYSQDIATDSIAVLTSDQPVLLSFSDTEPGDGLVGYPAGARDLYGVKSQYNLIGAPAASSFSIFCSSHASTTIASIPAGALQPNQICSGGAQGTGDAVRLTGINGAINAIQQDDGDGQESTMFLPFKEFSNEYMLPTNAAYIAVVCAASSGPVDLSVYDQNDNFVSSSTCSGVGAYPGKAYFGVADATTFLAGSRIVATNGVPFYAYYEDTSAGAAGGAETNLFGAVQTRNFAAVDPAYAFGAEEIAGPPSGLINSAAVKADGSGKVAISIAVNDLSRDDSRAKIEYVPQTAGVCNFASPLKPTLIENSISAEFGAPVLANKNIYQIGTSTGWITTASGTNNILFNWDSKTDLPAGDGTYCLRLTANDQISDQTVPATTTVVIDNAAPTVPGNLTLLSKTGTSVTLKFATTSVDSHFKEYRIYYKQYDGTPVTGADTLFGSTSDPALAAANFKGATTTSIGNLTTGLKYDFNLFAYDTFGNRASSSQELEVTANDAPTASLNAAAEKTDGSGRVSVSFAADDADNDNTLRAKLEYQPGSKCDFASSSLATIDPASVTATFGTVHADNNQAYRLGTSSYYILTSLGKNTINFDWLSRTDLATASGTYCLRLTANDGVDDQLLPETKVVVLDNIPPTAPGNLAAATSTETSIQLLLPKNKPAQDDNEPAASAYKIFYKAGTGGVTSADTPFTAPALDAYDFNGSSTVTVTGLAANTHYFFNLFAYDAFGNTASATEITARTDADLTNKSLTFINPEQSGTSTNIAVADGASVWDFRAKVSDVDGFSAIDQVDLYLNDAWFDDIAFSWTRSTGAFASIGSNVSNSATLSPQSTSSCAGNTCLIDYKVIFSNSFASSSVNYSGELFSSDSSSRSADDIFDNLFQVRKSWIDQQHYRWRNDNGGG